VFVGGGSAVGAGVYVAGITVGGMLVGCEVLVAAGLVGLVYGVLVGN